MLRNITNIWGALTRGRRASASGLIAAAMALFAFSAKAADAVVQLDVSPRPVIVGEAAELHIISTVGFADLERKPEARGLVWNDSPPMTVKRTSIVNARRVTVFDTTYSFTVNREGTITIPSMTIHVGNIDKRTTPFSFKTFKRKLVDGSGKTIPLDNLLFATTSMASNRKQIYVGEEVPLEIRLYSIKGLDVSPSAWPALNIENTVTRDYSAVNPDSPHFFPSAVQRTIKVKGKTFNVTTFKCRIRAISPGTLKGSVSLPCVIKIPVDNSARRRTGDPFDDFFAGGLFTARYRNARYKLTAELDPKQVLPLPQPPEKPTFLGLVGDWKVRYAMTSDKLKVGEAVTLKISIAGDGTLDTLAPPSLKLDGFRVYPPETKKSPSLSGTGLDKADIQYAVIPLRPGQTTIKLALATFSPKKGRYVVWRMEKKFDVAKNANMTVSFVDGVLPPPASGLPNHSNPDILYLKKEGMGRVRVPLTENKSLWIAFFILLGPICLIASELMAYRKNRLSDDPNLRRKMNARKKRGSVISKIRKSPPERVAEIARNDVTPYLNDLLGFPPGTSPEELARKIDNPEMAECLRASGSSSYMPGAGDEIEPNELKKKLLKALRKLSAILLLPIMALVARSSVSNAGEAEWKAYDNGKPGITERFYEEKLNPDRPDPAWLYNIGNCEVKKGNLPKALVFYERARRLAPGDSDILENLNYVRRRLMLPEVGTAKTPLDSLINMRDSLRPDSWIMIASIFWTLAWIALALRRGLSTRQWVSALVILVLLMNIAIVAFVTQKATTYNPAIAIVVKNGVEVRPLPSPNDEGFPVRPGEEVKIEEERHDWLRIRLGNAGGWVKPDDVARLWPYD